MSKTAKVAVITGAAKGIGAATAVAFGNAGYDVVVNYLRDDTAAAAVVEAVEKSGNRVLAVRADVCTDAGVEQLFETVRKEFGKIDVLINNVGQPHEAKFGEYTVDSITNSLTGNVTAAVLCTQAAVPLMQDGSSILFTSSNVGLEFCGNPKGPLYPAGKAAIINFAQTMAEKLAPGIRCNVVAPGTTKTSLWDGVNAEYIDYKLGMNLQKEWVGPADIAETFIFLANAPHINAQTIVVDAGWQKRSFGKAPERKM